MRGSGGELRGKAAGPTPKVKPKPAKVPALKAAAKPEPVKAEPEPEPDVAVASMEDNLATFHGGQPYNLTRRYAAQRHRD